MMPSIYEYKNIRDYFDAMGRALARGKDGTYSQAQWARRLGYRSRRTVGMVLSGTRKPSQSLLDRFAKSFELTAKEKEYLRLLSKMNHSGADSQAIAAELLALNQNLARRIPLKDSEIGHMARWYHLAIKQLVQGMRFPVDENEISRRLGQKVSPADVKKSLDKMFQLGILEKDKTNCIIVPSKAVTTADDLPSAAVRQHHREQAIRAIEALLSSDVNDREFCSLTIRFDPSKMRAAKEFLRNAVDEFDRTFFTKSGTNVFQLNVQFFSQTTKGGI